MVARERQSDSGEQSAARRAAPRAADLAEGSVIAGRYRVEQKLGHGGMGDVYRVCEERTGQRLALKRHRRDATDDTRRANLSALFEREYHSLVQLAHPHIIEVYDYGVDADNTPFYTMELLDGEDLHARAPRPWPEACRLLLDVASSLAILHTRRLLHRDLTPRNVRCTSDGRAKLIDFGATVPMGAVKTVAGSPKFIAPEALQEQALDARSDLYSLGVLAYWLLTGRYPYAVKTFAALHDAWRTLPPSPVEFVPEIPEGLDHLVMELLEFDRMARPASAAEVMERLSAVTRVPLSEAPAVPNAYLVTPPLIGRAELLASVRARLMRAQRGRARAILIEGCAGSGRSRMLDACVLEAKLLGMSVLRADASDGARGPYGVARKLCAAMLAALPEAAQRAAIPRRALLAHVCERFANADDASSPRPERQRLQAAVLEFWQEVASCTPIAIAIDDADTVDAPSAALLAAVTHLGARSNITLILTRHSSAPTDFAIQVVRGAAKRFVLASLDQEQTEALLGAVFGEVQHLAPVAACVHALSDGNPLQTMALCESLVTRGLAQYEAGGWKLPPAIARGELPESMSAEWRKRMAALTRDAQELAVVFALVEPGALSVGQYAALPEHGDRSRCYRALDALVMHGIVVPIGQHHRLVQREVVAALAAELPAAHRRTLHARIARALEQHANPLLAIDQLFLAGCPDEAVERLLRLCETAELEPSLRAMALLDQAVDAAPALNLSARRRLTLVCSLVTMAAVLGDRAAFVRHGLPLLERVELESGLRDYLELGDLPPSERLPAALERARIRHESEPEHTRGSSPIEALTQLGRLCSAAITIGLLAQDVELLARLPSLEPLVALSPAFEVLQLGITAGRLVLAGRICDAIELHGRSLARVSQPDRAGLSDEQHQSVRLGVLYIKSVFAAGYGLPNACDAIAELEHVPGYRASAARVHLIAALMRGDVESARTYQRRAELLALEDGEHLRYRGTTERVELLAHSMAWDVHGIKGAMERIESVHAVYPGWAPTLALARSQHRRVIGDAAGALVTTQNALLTVAPAGHHDWPLLAANEASLLSELGRHDEAIAHALEMFAVYEREKLSGTTAYQLQVVAEVLHAAGRHVEALPWAERCIESCESEERHGLCLGSGYEIRARLAAALGDAAGFEDYARRCADEYQLGRSAALSAKYGRLIRYAQQLGIQASSDTQRAADWSIPCSASSELSDSADLVTRKTS